MKYLKSLSAICLISALAVIFACGSDDDPYKSSRPINQNGDNEDYSGWSPPAPSFGGGGGGGGANNSGGPDDGSINNPTALLKDLDQTQINELCAATYQHYKKHDNPTFAEGRGACLDFAVRRAEEIAFAPETRFMICEDELIECLSFTNQSPPTASCMNPRAQVTCEATVGEFERCASHDAKLLTSYFLQIHNHTCSDYTTDFDLAELDALLATFPQPQDCITLLKKCPQIFN